MRILFACTLIALSASASAAPALPSSLATTRFAGPFASMEAACPGCGARDAIRKPPAPWLEVRVLMAGNLARPLSPGNSVHHYLAVHLRSGWWTQEIGRNVDFEGAITTSSPRSPEARDVLPSVGAELTIEVRQTTQVPGEDGEAPSQTERRTLHICGVGPSGAPSCTAVETYRFAGQASGSLDTPVSFNKAGEIVVAGKIEGLPAVPRRYRVDFP
ncbi:MAG TPA: hypothetical protein VH853_25730 [Polyangia bacterium]|nr:hypothetical protein [Polyangia bacterium]